MKVLNSEAYSVYILLSINPTLSPAMLSLWLWYLYTISTIAMVYKYDSRIK